MFTGDSIEGMGNRENWRSLGFFGMALTNTAYKYTQIKKEQLSLVHTSKKKVFIYSTPILAENEQSPLIVTDKRVLGSTCERLQSSYF